MILILTNKEDIHPNSVIKYLGEKNAQVFRLNTESILTDYKIHWIINENNVDVIIENIITKTAVKGSEIKSIWERRPEKPSECNLQNIEMKELCIKEATGFLQNLQFYFYDKFWLGHPLFDRLSFSKMLQMKVASDVGFNIPDTIISNDFVKSKSFFEKHTEIAQKAIEVDSFDYDSDEYSVFWTKKLNTNDLLNFPKENFELTYNHIQKYIVKKFELRVTVVVNQIFACKFETNHLLDDKGKVDFRQGYDYGLKLEVFDLPVEFSNKCIEYLKKMNLNFGCFDFLVDEFNNYFFLECNSNGQWLWIEEETGLNITKSIGDFLINGYGNL